MICLHFCLVCVAPVLHIRRLWHTLTKSKGQEDRVWFYISFTDGSVCFIVNEDEHDDVGRLRR